MNRIHQYLAALLLAGCVCPSMAMVQFLTQDLGIQGNAHHCKYSNNKVYTVDASALCPLQIDDSPFDQPENPNGRQGGSCLGYSGPGGACYSGPGGGLYAGPGGGMYSGPGGGLYSGPGGGLYSGPGGGMYAGPGGGLYDGPGGGLYSGPGGGIYPGPPSNEPDSYKGPWGPCITGAATVTWLQEHCPNRRR